MDVLNDAEPLLSKPSVMKAAVINDYSGIKITDGSIDLPSVD
jgi:hypothetical protein